MDQKHPTKVKCENCELTRFYDERKNIAFCVEEDAVRYMIRVRGKEPKLVEICDTSFFAPKKERL